MEWVIFINDKFFDFANSLEEAKEKVIKKRRYLGGRLRIIQNSRTEDGKYFYIRYIRNETK